MIRKQREDARLKKEDKKREQEERQQEEQRRRIAIERRKVSRTRSRRHPGIRAPARSLCESQMMNRVRAKLGAVKEGCSWTYCCL